MDLAVSLKQLVTNKSYHVLNIETKIAKGSKLKKPVIEVGNMHYIIQNKSIDQLLEIKGANASVVAHSANSKR